VHFNLTSHQRNDRPADVIIKSVLTPCFDAPTLFTWKCISAIPNCKLRLTGRPADELVEDAMAGYFGELVQVRELLDSRYDDIKGGKVQLMDGEVAFARLKEKTEAQRPIPV
jgi:hypothetical protein